MAAWQCDFILVPARALSTEPTSLPPDDLLAADWWAQSQPPANFESHIADFLPEGESWSLDLRTWGVEDSTRIDVWRREANRVDSIRVRVDARQIDVDALRAIVRLALYCNAAFLRRDGLFIPADNEALISAVDTSAAARFVNDPSGFIRRIVLGEERDG